MGMRKTSPWLTIPSEQGCTDWSRTSRCKTPCNWRVFLPPTDFISPYRKLGQGQHNSEVLHSWYLCSILVMWWDGTGTDGLCHHCRAGHAMPDLSLLLWWILSLHLCGCRHFLLEYYQTDLKVTPQSDLVFIVYTLERSVCSKGPANIFRMHIYLLNMPTN